MQRLAMSWLVYRLTDSTLWLGIINFSGLFTSFLLMPWAGVILDCGSRRKILMCSQMLGFTQAAILAYLTIFDLIDVKLLLIMSVVLGLVNAFDMPGRHSFVSDLVTDKKLLGNAIALNSSVFNMARLVGPALAGIIVARAGEGICFLLNSLSFLPFAIALFKMKINETTGFSGKQSWVSGIAEGITYALKHQVILPVLAMLATASLMGMSIHMVLLPVVADKILMGGSETLGYLTGAMGFGAVGGALWLASRKSIDGLIRVMPVAFGFYGVFAILLSQSTSFIFSFIIACFMGLCMVNGFASSNTLLQTISDKRKRSRVMSLYLMCFTGMSPIGSLLMGWISSEIEVRPAMILGGSTCILAAFIFTLHMRGKAMLVVEAEA
ncbi:MAG: hypothetical protein PWR01_3967 [Clostridiales bacterium]|nr:hypothetical protein [Clostridiales bacterium]MDN5282894.1 hypothetical protein [Candidatus Ozemobacter sp.]